MPRTIKSYPRNQERNWAAGVQLPGGPRTVKEPDLGPRGTGDEGEMTYVQAAQEPEDKTIGLNG